jgi:hypothetical protein
MLEIGVVLETVELLMNFAAKIVNNSNKAKPNHHRALFFFVFGIAESTLASIYKYNTEIQRHREK